MDDRVVGNVVGNAAGDAVGNAVGTDVTGPRPVQPRVARRRREAEPVLLGVLAAGGLLAAWSSGAGRAPWTATTTVAVLAASAELARRRDPRPPADAIRAARAALALASAAVAVGLHPRPSSVMLAWLPAVCAVYTAILPAAAAATLTTAALGVLAVLAFDAPEIGAPAATAFVACAVAVLAVSLAGRTVRAVLGTRLAGPAGTAAAGTAAAGTAAAEPVDAAQDHTRAAAGTQEVPVVALSVPELRPVGIPGRDTLLDAVARAQSRAGVVGGHVGLLVLSVEGVESVSGSLGTAAAQQALDTLARRARAWLPAGDVVAWLGAGRFAALLEGVDARTCTVVARRLCALLAEPVEVDRHVLSLPCSSAVVVADAPGETPSALLARVEQAPPLAEGAGLPEPGAAAAVPVSDPLAEELWPALCAGQVTVALQPIVAVGTLPRLDRVVAVEALARWTRPDGVSVAPARFVAAARRSGLADLLGATVLAQGLDAVARRRCASDPALGLCVNVAPEQLVGADFASAVLRSLASHDVLPGALTVEVPATASFHDPAAARASLEALRAGGVGVVLDNFGAAGLSIAALRDLPLTGVKLDRSLTAELGADDPLVVATVRLTTRLGLTCTAVGIETQAQLDAARSLGIDAVQGHLLGRPETEDADRVELTAGPALA